MRNLIYIILSIIVLLLFNNCNKKIINYTLEKSLPSIFPDYINVTIPYNIAPLNFKFIGEGDEFYLEIRGKSGEISLAGDNKFFIPEKKWKELLLKSKGDTLRVTLFSKQNDSWKKYDSFYWYVSPEAIDPYLVYRLIEPGYVGFNEMGIYQRHIESFVEKPIFHNDLTDRSCMNCHAFAAKNPQKMMFHVRLRNAGTIIIDGQKIRKINTKNDSTIAAGTYPAWHPSGKLIAFSVNKPQQVFHLNPERRAEISDIESDIVIFDIEANELFSDPNLMLKKTEETFPSFTADGKRLLFGSYTPQMTDTGYQNIKYSLCAIDFDSEKKKFGQQVDTIISASKLKKTIAFANASPNGKYILCSVADHGVFTSWNKESDLYLYFFANGELKPLVEANSDDSESYNSWSSNSQWIVFSSRRMDTHYNRPFISRINNDGTSTKAFVLPQKDPDFYTMFLKIYNRPELISGPVTVSPYDIEKIVKSEFIEQVSFKNKNVSSHN